MVSFFFSSVYVSTYSSIYRLFKLESLSYALLLLFVFFSNEWFSFSEETFLLGTFVIFFASVFFMLKSLVVGFLDTSMMSMRGHLLSYHELQRLMLGSMYTLINSFCRLSMLFESLYNNFLVSLKYLKMNFLKNYFFYNISLLVSRDLRPLSFLYHGCFAVFGGAGFDTAYFFTFKGLIREFFSLKLWTFAAEGDIHFFRLCQAIVSASLKDDFFLVYKLSGVSKQNF